MGKLFNQDEELEMGTIVREGQAIELSDLKLDSVFEEMTDYAEVATENLNNLLFQHDYLVRFHNQIAVESHTSIEYLSAYNDRKETMGLFGKALQAKVLTPSLEDITSHRTAEASKDIALESVREFIKKVWEKIKSALKAFFRKISEFLKRIAGANLEIDTYEKYVDDMLRRIKRDGMECKDKTQTVHSELGKYVCTTSTINPEPHDLLNGFQLVSDNFKQVVGQHLVKGLKEIEKTELPMVGDSLKLLTVEIKNGISVDNGIHFLNNLGAISNRLTNHVTGMTIPDNLVPGDVVDELASRANDPSRLVYRSLVNHTSDNDRLPQYFNIFTASTDPTALNFSKPDGITPDALKVALDDYFMAAVSSFKDDTFSPNTTVRVISDVGQLSAAHSNYKNFKLDVKTIVSLSDTIGKDCDKLISAIAGKTGEAFASVKPKSLGTKPKITKITDQEFEDLLLNYPDASMKLAHLDISDPSDCVIDLGWSNGPKTLGIVDAINDGTFLSKLRSIHSTYREKALGKGLSDSEIDDHYKYVINPWLKEMTGEEVTLPADPLAPVVVGIYERNLTRLFNTLPSMVKASVTDVLESYTKMRYEMVKYLYDSARTYS